MHAFWVHLPLATFAWLIPITRDVMSVCEIAVQCDRPTVFESLVVVLEVYAIFNVMMCEYWPLDLCILVFLKFSVAFCVHFSSSS